MCSRGIKMTHEKALIISASAWVLLHLMGNGEKWEMGKNGKIMGNLAIDIPLGGSPCPLFPGWIGIRNVGFCRGRKTGGPREKPLEQGREPTTTSAHIWRTQVRELNPGHSGRRQALSPLHHPCSPSSTEIKGLKQRKLVRGPGKTHQIVSILSVRGQTSILLH